MFHIVSKLFTFLLMPLGILIILTVCTLVCKNRTKAKRIGILTLLLTYLFSAPFLVNVLVKSWEAPQKNIYTLKNYDVGILLTGGLMKENAQYPENLHLANSSDRLWQTLQLYKEGRIKNILISGGDFSLEQNINKSENYYAQKFLLKNGIPAENIYLDTKSRNTNENAINSSKVLKQKFDNRSYLLVTSAFHMKRAMACFKKRGVNVSSFPSDIISSSQSVSILDFIPSTYAFNTSSTIVKEIIGLIIYKIMGYA